MTISSTGAEWDEPTVLGVRTSLLRDPSFWVVALLSLLAANMVLLAFAVWAYVTQPGLKDCILYGLPAVPLALVAMELTQKLLTRR